MNRFVQWFKNTFGFSQKEINGFVIMVILMVLMFLAPLFFPNYSGYSNQEEDRIILDSILNSIQQVEVEKKEKRKANTVLDENIEYSKFNPNNCSVDQWQIFGVSEKIAKRIHNYTNNGGQFRKKGDLKKIYGFPVEKYTKLFPYIDLPEKAVYNKTNSNGKRSENPEQKSYYKKKEWKEFKIEPFEINSCSAEELIQIRGIGEKLAERIIKFRDKLGGFNSKNQFSEIYGLDSTVVSELIKNSTIDKTGIVQININTATYEELIEHIFIKYKVASAIVNYRKQHGNFTKVSDLKKIYSLNEATYLKIEPYLKVK